MQQSICQSPVVPLPTEALSWEQKGTTMRTTRLVTFLLLLSLLISALATYAAASDTVVVQWNNAALQAIRDVHPGPPMCARALAIVHTCAYDAWACYDPVAVGTETGGPARRPASERTLANKNQAVSYAAYRALVDLFPQASEVAMFNTLMANLGYDPNDTSADPTTPTGIGNLCAAAVTSARHHDGANQLGDYPGGTPGVPYSDYTGYVPVNDPDHIYDPNRWQPLRVSDGKGGYVVQKFVGAQWFNVVPFAMSSGAQFRPVPPDLYPHGGYRAQAEEMLHYSAKLDDTQKMIAEYWADGPKSETPPGHWCLFGQFVSQRDNHDVDADTKMFFALTNAVLDASISSWDAKRYYDSVRPITAIHFLFAGKKVRAWAGPYQGTKLIDGANWQPYQPVTVVTPPFPEYFSGHSTFSAAGAEILKRFTGSDYFGNSVTLAVGSSRVEPGATPATPITLSWLTFSDAADQAGISRRYGGIHFEDGDLTGRAIGRLVGAQVWDLAQAYINGTANP